jgi:hypothetical protein
MRHRKNRQAIAAKEAVGMGDQAKVSATEAMKQWGSVKKTGLPTPFCQTMAETQALLGPGQAGS